MQFSHEKVNTDRMPPFEWTQQTVPWILRKSNKEAKNIGLLVGRAKIYGEKKYGADVAPQQPLFQKVFHPAPPTHICYP